MSQPEVKFIKELNFIENKFRTIAEIASDAIIIIDRNLKVLFSNSKVLQTLGYTQRELLGQSIQLIIPVNYQDSHQKAIERFINTGTPDLTGRTYETEVQKKDGSIIPIEISLSYWEEGESSFFSGTFRDITERKNKENALLESEAKFRILAENSTDVISMHQPDSTIMYVSPSAETVLGYSPDEMIGRKAYDYYHPEDLAKMVDAYNVVLEVPDVYTATFRFRKKDGNYIWFESTARTVRNHEGKPVEIHASNRDISERKQAEDALRRAQERFKLLIDAVNEYAIYMLDPQGFVVSWNLGAKRLKGYTEEEVLGKHFSMFFTGEAIEKKHPEYELKEAKLHGRFQEEGWRVRKDGSSFLANITITSIHDPVTGEFIGFSKITRDLTERKLAEAKLNKLNAELEQRVNQRTEELSESISNLKKTNNDLDNFIYTASHDLKAPISNIEGLIAVLNDAVISNNFNREELRQLTELMSSSISRLKETINDLTEITKIQKDSQEDIAEIECTEIIDEVLQSMDHLIKETKAIIHVNVSAYLKINFSKKNFRSIIYNLLNNAIKYRDSRRKAELYISTKETDEAVVLAVKDNGLGIDLGRNRDKMFSMFKRFHDHVEGSGIGLYLVKRMMDNAGGKIEVESEVGKGSMFKLYFKKENVA